MNIKTYTKRAYRAEAFSDEQLRNESNAFHHLIGQLTYLADTTTLSGRELDGNEVRTYGVHVIKRLKQILEDYEHGKELGKKAKANLERMRKTSD